MTRAAVRTRRLIVVGLILVIGVAALGAAYLVRNSARQNLIHEARIEGLVAYHDGEYETALQKLSYALRGDRRDLEVLLAFADARSRIPTANNRHVLEAAQVYLAAIEIDPENLVALSGILLLYEQLRRDIEWMEVADRILAQEPENIEALRLKAIGHRIHSRFELSTETVLRLIELEPDDLRWRGFRLALLRDQDAPLTEILALCDQWIDEYDGDGRYYLMKSQVMMTAGQVEHARNAVREAARRGAAAAEILQPMLSLLDALQLREEADQLVAMTRRDYPEAQWPHEAAVRRAWQSGQVAEALAEIDALREANQTLSRELLRWHSLLLVLTGKHDDARSALSELHARADIAEGRIRDTDRAWAAAMEARMEIGQTGLATTLNAYRTALALSPNDPVLHFLAGEAYARLSEHELAVASFERAHRSDPNWQSARLQYAEALIQVNKPRAAYDTLLDLVRRGEGGTRPYVLFARAWLAAGEPSDVLQHLTDATTGRPMRLVDLLNRLHEAVPESAEVREVLVHSALRYGRRDLAGSVMNGALHEDDPDPRSLVALARISLFHRAGMEGALIERVHGIMGLTYDVASVLARVHHAEGQRERALAVLQSAIDQSPDDASRIVAKRVRVAFLVEIDDETAGRALADLLDLNDPLPATTLFVLSQPPTWDDPELAERAIDSLAQIVGESSPRLSLLRANFILRYRADQPAELARARSMTAEALQIAPDSLAALNLMAQLALAGDSPNFDLAIRHLERAVAAYPDQGDLYVRLVTLHQRQGNYREADRYLNRLGNLTASQPDLMRAEIQLLEMQGNYEGVVARLTQMLDQSDVASETDRLLLFSRLHMTGQHTEAERLIKELLASPAPSEITVRLAAEFYANLGRYDEGLALLQAYNPPDGAPAKAVTLGRYYQQNGRMAEALASFKEAQRLDPGRLDAIINLSQLHGLLGDSRAAYDVARLGLEKHPDNGDLQALLVMTSAGLGEDEQSHAMSIAMKSDKVDAALISVAQLQSRVPLVAAGDNGEAVRRPTRENLAEARRLVEQHPHYLTAWTLAIELHLAADQRDEAIRLATQATVRLPNRFEPAQRAAELLAAARRFPEALEMGRTWRSRSLSRPINADLFIATMALANERPRDAVEHLRPHTGRFLAEHEQHPERLAVWLYVQLRAGLAEQAVERMRPLLGGAEGDGVWRTAYLEAIPLLDQTPARRALDAIQPLLLEESQWLLALASGWSHFAHRFDDARAFDRAENYARIAAERNDDLRISSMMIRAQNADWRGDESIAEGFFREALSIEPENPIILNNLADLIVRMGGRCDEAAHMAARAVAQAPEFPEILDTHANALLCLDDSAAAERLARRAIEMRPTSPYFLVTLGLSLAAQERWDEARGTLQKVERIMSERDEPATRPLLTKIDRLRSLVDATASVSDSM